MTGDIVLDDLENQRSFQVTEIGRKSQEVVTTEAEVAGFDGEKRALNWRLGPVFGSWKRMGK